MNPDTTDPHGIKWGYNLADLDRLSRVATRRCFARGGTYLDRYEAAWTAIAEALTTSPTAPAPGDLITVGLRAVNETSEAEYRHHGISNNTYTFAPNFARYWSQRSTPSPERRLVEKFALWQIVPELPPREWEVIKALAATGDHELAARALGMTRGAFSVRLSKARRRFLKSWHQGETPSTIWRTDRRTGARSGTYHGRPRITFSQLEDIRGRYQAGETQGQIAVHYGVSRPVISRLLRGATEPATELQESTHAP